MPEKKSNEKETKKRKRPVIWIIFSLISLFMAAVIVLGLANLFVIFRGSHIKDGFEGENYDCILVLGAGLNPDGTPSAMLADRLDVAIDLYEKGVSKVILLSGDRTDKKDYDEVRAMEEYCLENGVILICPLITHHFLTFIFYIHITGLHLSTRRQYRLVKISKFSGQFPYQTTSLHTGSLGVAQRNRVKCAIRVHGINILIETLTSHFKI